MDIEGTTTPLAFVRDVLFPLARREMFALVHARGAEPNVKEQLDAVRGEMGQPRAPDAAVVAELNRWAQQDRKATPLKTLQGLVWDHAYRTGALTVPIYPDVVPALERWRAGGASVIIYSSGSVHAQRMLFEHTNVGDLSPLIDGYFDTTTGAKVDAASYTAIASARGVAASTILFLSDSPLELAAAKEAGLTVLHVAREGTPRTNAFPTVTTFEDAFARVEAP